MLIVPTANQREGCTAQTADLRIGLERLVRLIQSPSQALFRKEKIVSKTGSRCQRLQKGILPNARACGILFPCFCCSISSPKLLLAGKVQLLKPNKNHPRMRGRVCHLFREDITQCSEHPPSLVLQLTACFKPFIL